MSTVPQGSWVSDGDSTTWAKRVAHDFTALEALYNYIHKFKKLRFKLRKMSYKREVGKGRDRAPESMIIPFLKHITKIQH